MVVLFSMAAFLTRLGRRCRWRPIQVLGFQLTGLVITGLWTAKAFYYRSAPLWQTDWLIDFFNRPKDLPAWMLLIFVLGYTMVFWAAGIRYALQAKSYTRACSRFDRGLMAFFGLFIVKLIMQARLGIQSQESIAVLLVFPFFLFSLTEIGLARSHRDRQPTEYLAGYTAVGVLASFTLGALIIGSSIFMFFLPYLKMASAVGYDLMQSAARPLAPILVAIVKFIFSRAGSGPVERFILPDSGGGLAPAAPDSWLVLVQKILVYGGALLLLVLGVALVGLGIRYLLRWLFSPPAGGEENRGRRNVLYWWQLMRAILIAVYEWILRTGSKQSALEFYAALRRWGRHSGLPQASNETPLEFGMRLATRFPKLKTEILLIVEMLQQEVYGEYFLSAQQILATRQAWQMLHSPFSWPLRIKSILMNS